MAYNIIIVDDSTTVRGMIRKILGKTNLPLGEIWEAANGQEGLEKMRENWVDLVLADLNMPVMTGQEMIEAMKKDEVLATIPVVVVSSDGNEMILDFLAKKGVTEFVQKPFGSEMLGQIIERALEEKPAAQA
jgi:two-component system chemotaxis response regulator CheY